MRNPLHRTRFWLDHRWAPPHMSDYLDDELGSGSRQRMERHVGECKECRRLLDGLRELLSLLRGLHTATDEATGRITATVRLRIEEPGGP